MSWYEALVSRHIVLLPVTKQVPAAVVLIISNWTVACISCIAFRGTVWVPSTLTLTLLISLCMAMIHHSNVI